MLYDRFAVFARQARAKYKAGEIGTADSLLTRATDVVSELHVGLDMSQGDMSRNLASIYVYIGERLGVARGGNLTALDETVAHMADLREAWVAIAGSERPSVRRSRPAVGVNISG